MRQIRQARADDFVDGYPHLDLATRAMLARRANLRPGTTVAALRAQQAAANKAEHDRHNPIEPQTWDGTPERHAEFTAALKRVNHRDDCSPANCQPAPHDKTMQELQGWTITHEEYGESIARYIAGDTNHPLVQKFGWVKTTAIKHEKLS